MRALKHVWFIALKDLRLFVTDRTALFFFILFPFFFVVLFNFLLAGVGSEDDRLELHMVTMEVEGGLSHEMIAGLETIDESQLEPGDPIIVWNPDYDEARQAVEDETLTGFVAFPADFTDSVMAGEGSHLEVVVDDDAINTRAALNGLAQAIASRMNSQRVAAAATVQLLIEQGVIAPGDMAAIDEVVQDVISEGMAGGESFIDFQTEQVGEVEAESVANVVIPGYLVMFVFFASALGAGLLVRERQNHTLERLLATSVRRDSLVGGMFTGAAGKGLIQISIFWTVGILAFKIDLGVAPAAVILLSVLMVVMSASFGIMLATLAKTDRSADSIAVLTSLVLAPLGGCWWPLFITPDWMQFIAKFTPHGWATTGFNKLMVFGAGFGDVVPEMLALLGFAALFGTIAVWRFRASAD